ncbi:hypothetical protein D3C87_1712260 [compost metagenome]|uniref:Uncharacterized protein n=1 Tax=Cupriavidus campinensis TaxID=151783 RepID=A0AAE9HYK2_9BURK|nr:hypothetical protein [Cupriavidus campinensis]URF03181.1 hypothetical protein M5D45_11575 [Cupriavidus campinensis]
MLTAQGRVEHYPDAPQPPWIVFPHTEPGELAPHVRQGVAEPWFDREWRPFWTSLTPIQRDLYLDGWQASPEWREAIAFVFESFSELDVDQDAKESEEYLRANSSHPKRCSLLNRLFKR